MFTKESNLTLIRLIIVKADNIVLAESSAALKTEISLAIAGAVSVWAEETGNGVSGGPVFGAAQRVKDAVRNMLRTKAFKPTGRNKPASEYLAQAAAEQRFPYINNAVDVNNLLSLETGLPVSLLDSDFVGETGHVRLGRDGERYVFNSAGHEIELEGLAVFCGSDEEPLGNAIKDSMRGKLKPETKDVTGVVWAPAELVDAQMLDEQTIAERFAGLLETYCRATHTSASFV